MMEIEKEITIQITCTYEKLHSILLSNGFEIKEKYNMKDYYMIDSNIDIDNMESLEILKKCILVRDIENITKQLLYKYKKYDEKGNILEQGKIKCPITDINKAIEFMKAINYKTLFSIEDKCTVYANNKTELIVQLVNNKYIFVEMESKCQHINREYKDIDEMINDIDSYKLPCIKDNYFVKKAEIILNETLNRR